MSRTETFPELDTLDEAADACMTNLIAAGAAQETALTVPEGSKLFTATLDEGEVILRHWDARLYSVSVTIGTEKIATDTGEAWRVHTDQVEFPKDSEPEFTHLTRDYHDADCAQPLDRRVQKIAKREQPAVARRILGRLLENPFLLQSLE